MKKNKGFSLVEVIATSAIFVMVFSSAIGASIMLRDVCYASIAAHELQRNASLIMGYIIQRGPGETAYNGLRSASSFDLSDYSSGDGISFTGLVDTEIRRYYVEGNSVIYESSTIPSGRRTVYTAPPGVTIFLLFSAPFVDNQTVSITIDLSQTIRGKNISGNLVTQVNLMNASQ